MHLTRWFFLSFFFLPPVELHRRPSHLFCYALFAFFPLVVEIHQSLLGWPFSTANSNFSLGNNARAHDDRNLVGGPHPSLTSRKMMHAPPRSISNFLLQQNAPFSPSCSKLLVSIPIIGRENIINTKGFRKKMLKKWLFRRNWPEHCSTLHWRVIVCPVPDEHFL